MYSLVVILHWSLLLIILVTLPLGAQGPRVIDVFVALADNANQQLSRPAETWKR
jgi:hypothetical protein